MSESKPPPEPMRAEEAPPKGGVWTKLKRYLTASVLVALLVGVAGGGVGGFFIGREFPKRRAPRPIPGPAYVKLDAHSPRKGPKHAKVTIIEFSDFQ